MRKIFPLCFIALTFGANAASQSGRRVVNPPPPRNPVIETPGELRPERLPPAPAELSALPESLLNRELKAIDNGSFRLADFGGKVVVVNLWASWCGPCRMEIPDYEKVRKEYAGRAVEFIGLTTEDPRTSSERVKKFVRDVNFGFRLGWADPLTARTLMNGRNAIPQTLVLAPDGHIVSHWRGYTRGQSRDRLRETIERALSGASPGQKSQ
jgi:thiol-disulfide isomerase/thioredoxin